MGGTPPRHLSREDRPKSIEKGEMTLSHIISQRTFAAGASIALMAALAASCHGGGDSTAPDSPNVLASVGTEQLTIADVSQVMPGGLSEADSTAFVNAYIDNWIDNQLISQVAVRNIADTHEIDEMVSEYRRQLIINEYRRLKLSEDPELAIPDDTIAAYYSAHRGDLRLEEPMLRGIYIKMPSDAPHLADVKRWYRSNKTDDIDKLEKVGLSDAIHYDYFRDHWIPWTQIETKIPQEIPTASLRKGRNIEIDESGFTYLLSISDYLPSGAPMPLEAAKTLIREKLTAMKRVEIDAKLRQQLRQQALSDGTLKRIEN
jgi:hypothetical protein